MTVTLIAIVAIIIFGLITGTITTIMVFKLLRNNKEIPITHIPHFQKGNMINVRYIMMGNERKVEVEDAYVP